MPRKGLFILGLAIAILMSLATTAAGMPSKHPKPTTTTTTAPEYWSCQARVDNGASGWVLPETDDPYTVSGLAACIDILESDLDVHDWTVVWEGSAPRIHGLKLVFEEEVHGTVYAEGVFTTETGSWCPTFADTVPSSLVFIAMPHNGDKWTEFEITITPKHIPVACVDE